jgi:hypothetical protein
MPRRRWPAVVCLLLAVLPLAAQSEKRSVDREKEQDPYAGFEPLYRGRREDQAEWRQPKVGRLNPWKMALSEDMIDGVALSDPGAGDKHLWTRQSFRDFTLLVDWRVKLEPGYRHRVPLLGPDGNPRKGDNGRDLLVEVDDIGSGILLRGRDDVRVTISKWPSGSGEVLPFRADPATPADKRASYMPSEKADNAFGEWNTFEITLKGDRLAVKLNGKQIVREAVLTEIPRSGPIGLEHRGRLDLRRRSWREPPSLVQFRNVYVKELK